MKKFLACVSVQNISLCAVCFLNNPFFRQPGPQADKMGENARAAYFLLREIGKATVDLIQFRGYNINQDSDVYFTILFQSASEY